jgi:hypothetical protein
VGSAAAWTLRGMDTSAAGDVDLELVLVGQDRSQGQPICLAATAPLPASARPPPPLLPPGSFLRGRASCGGLESIDENSKARCAATRLQPQPALTAMSYRSQVALPLPRHSLAQPLPFSHSLSRAAAWDAGATDAGALEQYGSFCGADADADFCDNDGQQGEDLTWFSAGLRVGVGVGLGVCLGLGLGVGILVSSYQRATRRIGELKSAGLSGLIK